MNVIEILLVCMIVFTLFQNVFYPLEIFALILAAAIHDVNHPGVNNDFLVSSSE